MSRSTVRLHGRPVRMDAGTLDRAAAARITARASCLYCDDALYFDAAWGWLHARTGTLYITYRDEHGVLRDDHCATPTVLTNEEDAER